MNSFPDCIQRKREKLAPSSASFLQVMTSVNPAPTDSPGEAFANATEPPLPYDPVSMGLRSVPMILIMGVALFGNALVIISILRFHKLRSLLTNYFLLSLAFADFLVALMVMPFSLSMHFTGGRWPFGQMICNLFNANDVLFSTASLVHLCCISMDRYCAIVTPFRYESFLTRGRVAVMLTCCWTASLLISYIPIFTGIYTTPENLELMRKSPELCHFVVNPVYALVSSTVSFWIPCVVMTVVYCRIFVEARRQERKMYKMRKLNAVRLESTLLPKDDDAVSQSEAVSAAVGAGGRRDTNASVVRERRKLRREHKAAKTLGIIMGCFMFCWLPFFIWYTTTNVCGPERCKHPPIVTDVLFWIGYFNSTMNPIIYAFFNREFRNAFRRLLRCPERSHSYPAENQRFSQSQSCCTRGFGRHDSESEDIAMKMSDGTGRSPAPRQRHNSRLNNVVTSNSFNNSWCNNSKNNNNNVNNNDS